MDFANSQKVTPVVGITLALRADVISTQDGVKVELPPEKTVQSARAGDAVRIDVGERSDDRRAERQTQASTTADRTRTAAPATDAPREQDDGKVVESRLVVEQQTKSLVLQRRDTETGEVVELVPDEATLKLRIYARQQAERAQAAFEGRLVERTA